MVWEIVNYTQEAECTNPVRFFRMRVILTDVCLFAAKGRKLCRKLEQQNWYRVTKLVFFQCEENFTGTWLSLKRKYTTVTSIADGLERKNMFFQPLDT